MFNRFNRSGITRISFYTQQANIAHRGSLWPRAKLRGDCMRGSLRNLRGEASPALWIVSRGSEIRTSSSRNLGMNNLKNIRIKG